MKKNIKSIILVALVTTIFSSCSHRLVDFTVISTKMLKSEWIETKEELQKVKKVTF